MLWWPAKVLFPSPEGTHFLRYEKCHLLLMPHSQVLLQTPTFPRIMTPCLGSCSVGAAYMHWLVDATVSSKALCLSLGQFWKDTPHPTPPAPELPVESSETLVTPRSHFILSWLTLHPSTSHRCYWEHTPVNLQCSSLHIRIYFSGNLP